METKSYSIVVEMPDKKLLDVAYYCSNNASKNNNESFADLFIQLDDCICRMKIESSLISDEEELERIVHNKVIHEKGHLC